MLRVTSAPRVTTSLLVAAVAGGALTAAPPATASATDGPQEQSIRTQIVAHAEIERSNPEHNREAARDCNFYSGYWGNSGDNICSKWTGPIKWRSNQWCADFVRFVWKQGGARVNGLDPFAGSFYRAPAGKYHKKGTYRPKPGDAVLYDWDGARPGLGNNGWDIDHVGVVTSYNGKLTTVEGNTTRTSSGTGTEGVFQRSRSTKRVVGYVSPRPR
ncbi:CHAP domain-containing protein [Streptomyces sp. KR80]|uniref:CHAP domain-containing protein n=1 Tax=Streptomyces sp. KR80 TaxID=3457426 RepID=UPI003FD2F7E0